MENQTKEKQILVLGDSHARVFNLINERGSLKPIIFKVFSVDGATASGLENPNIKHDTYKNLKAARAKNPNDIVLTMLGEVDVGFVLWYWYQTTGLALEEGLAQTISTYTQFISELGPKTIVVSAPVPAVIDYQEIGLVKNLRKEIKANQLERTELTLKFNQAIQAFCEQNGIQYLNLDAYVLNEKGVLASDYRSTYLGEPYYEQSAFAALLEDTLGPIFGV